MYWCSVRTNATRRLAHCYREMLRHRHGGVSMRTGFIRQSRTATAMNEAGVFITPTMTPDTASAERG